MIGDHMVMVAITASVFAYLDPGSGSMLLSAIIGIVATLYFILKNFAYKLVSLPSYILNKKKGSPETRSIVIYSEGARYWNVFSPILHALNAKGIKCTYLSSEKNDPGLCSGLEHVETRYIGSGNKAFLMLNTLEAKICIMTTPGLDVLQIKRSKGVKQYCHITHSAGGVGGYSTYGLDYYDMVLVGGDGDKKIIEDIEAVRNTPPKEITVVGCTYLDVLRKKLAEEEGREFFSDNSRKTVIVSPTWGEHGILNKCGEKLLSTFAASNRYNIIIRPHPQAFTSDKKMISFLKSKFPKGEHLVWDEEPDGLIAMRQADIMISDFSGIIFDYLFLFNRPIIAFMSKYDKRGKDAMDLPKDSWNIQALNRLGGAYKEEDIPKLPGRIDALLENNGSLVDVIFELRSEMDKYPNESGSRAAQVIADSLAKQKIPGTK